METLVSGGKLERSLLNIQRAHALKQAGTAWSRIPFSLKREEDAFERACPAEGYTWSGEGGGKLAMPVQGVRSAGTWAYPSGQLHLGMDIAASMYTPVVAPGDGVVLYADAPAPDGGGYLGNQSGWPYGGGNTLTMLCQAEGSWFAISFFHLSRRIEVRPSQQVHQGDIMAYSGNSGNSSGPHTHIEVFALNASFEEVVSYFQRTADFSYGTGWKTPAACSNYGCRIRPEEVFGLHPPK